MRPIKLFAAMIALSLVTFPLARAQETETPTEKTTPTPAAKSEAKKSEAEKSEIEKAAPEKSATPSEKSAAREEKTEASPSPKSSPRAAVSTKPAAKGSVEAQLKDIETRWAAAFVSHDTKEIEPVLADDYVLTNEKGKVLNRAGALKQIRKNTDTYEKSENSNMVVHNINRDAAVVTGMTHDVGKDKSGKPFDRVFRWTDTFVSRNGKWQAVATQVTLVSQK